MCVLVDNLLKITLADLYVQTKIYIIFTQDYYLKLQNMNKVHVESSQPDQSLSFSWHHTNFKFDKIIKERQIGHQIISKIVQEKYIDNKIISYKWVRKQQPLILFLLCIGVHLYSVIQLEILIRQSSILNFSISDLNTHSLTTIAIRLIIIIFNSWFLGGFQGIFYSYTVLDIIGVIGLSNSAMFNAFLLNFYIPLGIVLELPCLSTIIGIFILSYCLVGNFRLMIRVCKWRRPYVVIYKAMLYFCCFFSVIYAIYYTMKQFDRSQFCTPCDNSNPMCQNSCKNFGDCCFKSQNLIIKAFQNMNNYVMMITGTSLALYSEMIGFMSSYESSQTTGSKTIGIRQYNEAQELNRFLNDNVQEVSLQEKLEQSNFIVQNNVYPIHENKDTLEIEKIPEQFEIPKINALFEIRKKKNILLQRII